MSKGIGYYINKAIFKMGMLMCACSIALTAMANMDTDYLTSDDNYGRPNAVGSPAYVLEKHEGCVPAVKDAKPADGKIDTGIIRIGTGPVKYVGPERFNHWLLTHMGETEKGLDHTVTILYFC